MKTGIINWLGLEFVELSGETPPNMNAGDGASALFDDFSKELALHGLSLNDTVRSRLFGRDRAARDAASLVRGATLVDAARAATSSYIAPARLESDAPAAMDLLALRAGPGTLKIIRENDPPRLPCRYLTCGPLVVLSGQTAVLPTLEAQVTTNILPRITEYLAEAKIGWDQVAQVSCYLHRSETADTMRALFNSMVATLPPRFDVHFVDGYSAEGKLVEVEVTAMR